MNGFQKSINIPGEFGLRARRFPSYDQISVRLRRERDRGRALGPGFTRQLGDVVRSSRDGGNINPHARSRSVYPDDMQIALTVNITGGRGNSTSIPRSLVFWFRRRL